MFERLQDISKYILSICTLCVCLTACGSVKAVDTKYTETENMETPISGEGYIQSQVETVPATEDNQVEAESDSDETSIALEFTGMLEEMPELVYSGGNYICYKDMLVFDFDDTVYRWQNEQYQRTDESLADMLGIKNQRYFTYRQSKNLIVTKSEDEKSFLVYDMDTDSRYAYPCNHNMRIWYPWYVYDGEIYYMEYEYDEENRVSHVDGAIRKINLADGKDTEVYRSENIWYFFMRGDGIIFYEGHGWHDYWKLERDENGEYKETKLWETDRWEFREWLTFNQYGLIVVGQFPYIDDVSGELFEQVVIKDNGEAETMYLPGEGEKYLDNGYLTYDYDSVNRVTGVTCYDYEGNILATYPLISKSKLDEGFGLARLLYYDEKITAIYEQEDTGELYIVRAEADFDQIKETAAANVEPDFDALNVYQSVLQKNEQAWEDPSYPMEDHKISGALGVLKGDPEYTLCYSFADIAGDGTEDLVIGARIDNEYILCGVYAYDRYKDAVHGCYYNYEVDPIMLCENGIIEHVHQMDGKTYYHYDKLIKNTSDVVGMDQYKYVFDVGSDEENGEIGYFKKNLSRWEKITEEEFWSAINKYELLPIELNWHELDGFWEPEEAGLSFDFRETEYEYSDENCNISLRYPQVTGSNDAEKEIRINRLIEEDIKKVSEWVIPDEYGRKLDVGVTWFKIAYADEKLISIVYSGWAGRLQSGSGLPTAMMATTIDCEKETVLDLQDVVSDFDGLCRLLLEDCFENITAWDGEPGQYKISESYWLGGAEALLSDLKGNDYDLEWYIGKDSFIIVDLNGKYYNEYSIEVKQVRDILREEFLEKLGK